MLKVPHSRGRSARGTASAEFRVVVKQNAGKSGEPRLGISTTQPGSLRVQLFDVQGRLVRTLVSEDWVQAGNYTLDLNARGQSRLASGIYVFRVKSVDGLRTGRVTFVR